ncbi:glycosyltransferase [Amphibacillus sp. MSJ-3]|uniref:glycosyltransferase n=1 Tax=Amphibacillus sp. MSJ-3 TaxID=2841505 RepID=UPI001C0EF77D|nr:glycosyltransferase [Amphibacillus sp. MSJ-3]MBU5595137.1 glycosyltransferase [Amphibacillus sp. MSJ-3]
MEWKNDHNKPVYFISNKCSQTIGGVQTKIRLIEEALPQQSFIEIPLVYNQKDIKLEKLPNVEIYSKVTGRKKPKDERRINLFENNNGKIKEKLNPKDSRLIVFGVQKLFFISNKILENNEIIIFQSNRPDVTFGTIESKKVPFILLDKIKYIDKFLFYTEEDKREIMFILNNSKVEYKFKSYVVPNPSKTIRKQISKYTNNLIYMGRFDMIQKNIKEYTRLAERLYPKYKINAYGDGIRKSLLDNSKVNVGGVIKDISQVADQNSILLLLSNYEGFGNVILEAYSVGMPVVVYDSYPAARSIVTNKAGKLVPYGDIAGVENAIEEILKDEATFQMYSNNAFEESKKYVKEDIINSYIHVIWDD